MCTVDQRDRVRHVARVLREREGVILVDDYPPHEGTVPRWSVECVLKSGGVPSAVLLELGSAGLELHESVPVGPHWRFAATVE